MSSNSTALPKRHYSFSYEESNDLSSLRYKTTIGIGEKTVQDVLKKRDNQLKNKIARGV